jgi:hypothetical protein
MGSRATRLLTVLGAALTVSCVTNDEVARVPSPSGQAEAVVFEGNGGATTSFWYDVYVVEPGRGPSRSQHVANLYGAVRNPSAYGVNLRWAGPHALAIEFLEAREHSLSRPTVTVGDQTIEIALAPGIVDPSAPGGGMLYNLRGRRR